jgi:hypothetical protein
MQARSIGVYSIFQGVYSALLPEFLENMRTHFLPEHPKTFYIVASDPELCATLLAEETDVNCVVKPNLGWPYGSLYRWNYFRKSFTPSPAISHIFFANANTRCLEALNDDILAPYVAVLHNQYVSDSYESMTFEKNPISTAYVPPEWHFRYFGARFLGATTANFMKMCEVLDENTQIDESNHFIAVWHDESHYNHYINVVLDQRQVKVLGPEYHVPEELLGWTSGAKVMYLDKTVHVPGFDATKREAPLPFDKDIMDLPAFRPQVYRALNSELAATGLSDAELWKHYLANPETPYFHETAAFAARFDSAKYMEKHSFHNELEAKFHFIRHGAWSDEQ